MKRPPKTRRRDALRASGVFYREAPQRTNDCTQPKLTAFCEEKQTVLSKITNTVPPVFVEKSKSDRQINICY
jgi:hypothetical protein